MINRDEISGKTKLLIAIVSAISGLLGAVGTQMLSSKEMDYGAYSGYVLRLEKRVDLLEVDVKQLNEINTRLLVENVNLKASIQLLGSVDAGFPYPEWTKDRNFTMLRLNKKYVDAFLSFQQLEAGDYIGKTDYDIYPKDVADLYRQNDMEVVSSKSVILKLETVITSNGTSQWIIIKWPWMSPNGEVLGVRGMAIPPSVLKYVTADDIKNHVR